MRSARVLAHGAWQFNAYRFIAERAAPLRRRLIEACESLLADLPERAGTRRARWR